MESQSKISTVPVGGGPKRTGGVGTCWCRSGVRVSGVQSISRERYRKVASESLREDCIDWWFMGESARGKMRGNETKVVRE